MNRNFTLILSAVVVFILLGVWLYLMFFADRGGDGPGSIGGEGEFTQFDNLGNNVPGGGTGQPGDNNGQTGDEYDPDILRQLTTRNMIGHKEVVVASTTYIVYMESGVGHIYGINLEDGVEERFTAVTIPDARHAVFSPDGSLVAVKTGDDTGVNPLSLASVDYESGDLSVQLIAEAVAQFTFLDDGIVLYTTQGNSSTVVRSFNPANNTSAIEFETPFREVTVSFGDELDSSHFFYPKTSHLLEGFVYEVNGGALKRLPIDGFGLTAMAVGESLITSYRQGSSVVSTQYNHLTDELLTLEPDLIPEKCINVSETVYCAIPGDTRVVYNSVDKWNQGITNFADNLWVLGSSSAEQLIDITDHSGRNVDVIHGLIGAASGDWYFQNKIDNSLWIYELSRLTEMETGEETKETES